MSPALLDGVRATDQQIDTDRFLAENIKDDQKRLAFRLYMDDVPFKSKKHHSIAKALGIKREDGEALDRGDQGTAQRKDWRPDMTDRSQTLGRDDVLFAFHEACPRPTVEEIIDWTTRYPKFADDIRAHAAVARDWATREGLPSEEPDETRLARAYSRALNALYKADADEGRPGECRPILSRHHRGARYLRRCAPARSRRRRRHRPQRPGKYGQRCDARTS